MRGSLYQVRFVNSTGVARMGHVRGRSYREATVKAKRFVIGGGVVVSVVDTGA